MKSSILTKNPHVVRTLYVIKKRSKALTTEARTRPWMAVGRATQEQLPRKEIRVKREKTAEEKRYLRVKIENGRVISEPPVLGLN
jgi:hypothetical protein